MKEILSKIGVDISELARRFGISRPTVYKYIKNYTEGNKATIPEKIKAFFDFVSIDTNQNTDDAKRFLLNSFPTSAESGIVETDQALESILQKFCDEKQTKDNFLSLVLPTGSRKTTSVIRFITDYIASGGERKIFFITTLKKNLPVNIEEPAEDVLRKSFDEYGIGDLYDERVMMVDSLANMLLKNYPLLSAPDKTNCRSIMGEKRITELNDLISSLGEIDESAKAYKEMFSKFREFEGVFRKALVGKLEYLSRDPKERKRIVTEEREWKWVPKLYPTVFTDDKQVFLMSMAKFVSTHDTIVNGRYSLYDSKLIDNSFIFIDEFDATKETVLERIIDADKDEADYVGIFRRIFRTLEHNQDIWKEYYRNPEDDEDGRRTVSAKDVLEIKERAEALAKDYNLECDFKLADSEPLTYIFRDNRIIKTGKNREFIVEYDEVERINLIRSVNAEEDQLEYKRTITSMLGRMYGLFRHFEAVFYILALNHMSVQESKGKPLTRDAAIRTMLDPYDFNEAQTKYLVNAIKFRPPKRANSRDPTPDTSFYEAGFEFFNFVDNDNHNLSTKIFCTSVKRTPEKMLMRTLDRAHGAKVVGISATARLRTVVGNYDFRYLKNQEDFSEYKISQQDRDRLREMFAKTVDCYEGRVNIIPKLIDSRYDIKEIIKNKRTAADLKDYLGQYTGNDIYIAKRYLRVFRAFYEFINAEDARSLLCFLNIFPREKGSNREETFSAELLRKIFVQIIDDYTEGLTASGRVVPDYLEKMKSEPFVTIKSDNFDKHKENLLNRLSKGEKIFVITTYSTVGAGQNLQYKIPSSVVPNIRYISSLAEPSKVDKKDFDAIYVDMPTNVAKNIKEKERLDLLSSLFDIESLQENHELDLRGARNEISIRFAQYYGAPPTAKRKKAMEYPSYRMAYARRIIQAIGRICRTFAKNSNIYIFADDQLGEVFKGTSIRDFADPNDRDSDLEEVMANPEFKCLLRELQNSSANPNESVLKELLDNESVKTQAYIDSMLRNKTWSTSSMRGWNSIREYVLTFPTLSADSKLDMVYNMYHSFDKPANCLRYRQEKDYHEVYIDPEGDCEVSEADARLADFLKIPSVSPMFGEPETADYESMPSIDELEVLHYANHFGMNTAIMCPALYHNIYKGALGEVSGKAILTDWGVEVKEIEDPSKFEKFDYVSGNGTYLDFKHWAGPGSLDNKKLIEWSFQKLKMIGGTKAIIVNVLKPKDYAGSSIGYTIHGNAETYRDRNGEIIDCTGLTIITVPYLYDCDNETAKENFESRKTITKEAI